MAFSVEPVSEEAEKETLPPAATGTGDEGEVSMEEWRCWGTSSPLPTMVAAVVRELLKMEAEAGEKMSFGGVGPKLKATFDCLMKTYGFFTPNFWRETKFVKAPFQEFTDFLAKPTKGLMLEAPIEKIEA